MNRPIVGGEIATIPQTEVAVPLKMVISAYRRLYYKVVALRSQESAVVIQFVSAMPGEGVTSTAKGFALVAEGESPDPVLMLDCGVLADNHPQDRRFNDLDEEILNRNLPLPLTVSNRGAGTINLVNSRLIDPTMPVSEMVKLLAEVRKRHRIVILDCPPLSRSPKAVAISQHCDGTVLVVRAGKTNSDDVREAIHDIRLHNGTLLGVVFNRHQNYLPRWMLPRSYI